MMLPGDQARTTLAMILCGAALGGLYTMLWPLRCMGRGWTAASDLFFGAMCAIGMITAGIQLRTDIMRWHILAGTVSGMGLFRISAGLPAERICALIVNGCRKLLADSRKRRIDAGKGEQKEEN